jgi:hypothetical protein
MDIIVGNHKKLESLPLKFTKLELRNNYGGKSVVVQALVY